MRFTLKEPVEEPVFIQNNDGWSLVEKISGHALLFIGIMLGVFFAGLLSFFVQLHPFYVGYNFVFYENAYLFLLVIPIHELFHLMCFPNPRNAVIGFMPKKLIFFVTTVDEFSKRRLVATVLMPLIIITIIPFAISLFVRNEFLISIVLVNLVGSGIDIVSFLYIVSYKRSDAFRFSASMLYVKRH